MINISNLKTDSEVIINGKAYDVKSSLIATNNGEVIVDGEIQSNDDKINDNEEIVKLNKGSESMKELRIIIAGSREFNDYKFLSNSMRDILGGRNFPECEAVRIVSGTARGADQLGERFAKEKGLRLTRMSADWDTYGKRAGYIRNKQMAEFSIEDDNQGVLVAFWDGISKGTKHMIDLANKNGLEVNVVKF